MVHVNFQGNKLGLNSQNIQQSVIDVRERQWTRAGMVQIGGVMDRPCVRYNGRAIRGLTGWMVGPA